MFFSSNKHDKKARFYYRKPKLTNQNNTRAQQNKAAAIHPPYGLALSRSRTRTRTLHKPLPPLPSPSPLKTPPPLSLLSQRTSFSVPGMRQPLFFLQYPMPFFIFAYVCVCVYIRCFVILFLFTQDLARNEWYYPSFLLIFP